jgi:hypothetical protein
LFSLLIRYKKWYKNNIDYKNYKDNLIIIRNNKYIILMKIQYKKYKIFKNRVDFIILFN